MENESNIETEDKYDTSITRQEEISKITNELKSHLTLCKSNEENNKNYEKLISKIIVSIILTTNIEIF